MPKPKIEIAITKVETLAAQGLSHDEIAYALGVSHGTFENRKRENGEIGEAIKRGRAKGVAVVTNKLFEKAKNGDLGAICFYLKTRAGWSEKVQIDNTSSDGSMASKPSTQIILGNMSDKEKYDFLAKLYQDEEPAPDAEE